MTKCIVIPQDREFPIARTNLTTLHDYQTAVGGFVEGITLRGPAVTIFCDEDGKSKELLPNARATALWWLYEPSARGRDIVVGDIVVVGIPDLLGDTTDIPEVLATFMVDGGVYKVEVCSNGGPWVATSTRFDDYFRAAMFAMRVLERTGFRADVQVVPA